MQGERMTARRLVALIAIVAGVGVAAVAALPALATHSWGGYHWARAANPLHPPARGQRVPRLGLVPSYGLQRLVAVERVRHRHRGRRDQGQVLPADFRTGRGL